jgi:cytochrome c oxidase assembly protein subunit 15
VHLSLALVIYTLIVNLALDLGGGDRGVRTGGPTRRFGRTVLAAIGITIVAGAFVAGTDAGFVYNTYPLMDGRLVPAGYGDLSPWWTNPFENVAAVQFNHRWLAVLTLLIVVAYVGWVHARLADQSARRLASWLGLSILAQVGLGILALLHAVPVALGAAHQAGAVIVLTLALATHRAAQHSARSDH